MDGVLLQGLQQHREIVKSLTNLGFIHTESLEEHGDRLLTLTINAHAYGVALINLELKPCPARGDDLGGEDILIRGFIGNTLEVHARRADKLRNDDALRAVDNEGAAIGHQREVANESGL